MKEVTQGYWECNFTKSYEGQELFFKLLLAYQAIVSAKMHNGVKFEVKNVKHKMSHDKNILN